MLKYIHRETGSIGDREDWLAAYSADELEYRGFKTAEDAFAQDVRDGMLVEQDQPNPAGAVAYSCTIGYSSEIKLSATTANGAKRQASALLAAEVARVKGHTGRFYGPLWAILKGAEGQVWVKRCWQSLGKIKTSPWRLAGGNRPKR